MSEDLLARARAASGLSQAELAERAGTSRPTLSAYENGRKSPSLSTAARIAAVAGYGFDIVPIIRFRTLETNRRRPFHVPDRLWRLPVEHAVATVVPPLHLDWSTPGRPVDLADPGARALFYATVLIEGGPEDILQYVDGALLVESWPRTVVLREMRPHWQALIDEVTGPATRRGR